jgi:xanthine dehydrogenase accessory factor
VKQLVDGYTAIVLMHHDVDKELGLLEVALQSDAFYIGALGSRRTHEKRILRLRELGYEQSVIDRIKAPIGMFGPARRATSLAISILADLAATRENTLGHVSRSAYGSCANNVLPDVGVHVAAIRPGSLT